MMPNEETTKLSFYFVQMCIEGGKSESLKVISNQISKEDALFQFFSYLFHSLTRFYIFCQVEQDKGNTNLFTLLIEKETRRIRKEEERGRILILQLLFGHYLC